MFFFPYKTDRELNDIPWLTILICFLCIGIYFAQFINASNHTEKTEQFCSKKRSNLERIVLDKAMGAYPPEGCHKLVSQLSIADNPEEVLVQIATQSDLLAGYNAERNQEFVLAALKDEYRVYKYSVPELTTASLWYAPKSWNPLKMVTASFSHASFGHIAGNLFFFFAFAAALELILGRAAFLLSIMLLVFGTSIAYSLAMLPVDDPLPTLGLSGVVMGVMAMLAYFLPRAKIRCFYWVIITFGTFVLPAWLLAVFYIGVDVYTLLVQDELGGINLIAHVGGAAIGIVLAVLVFRQKKQDIDIIY